MTLLQSKTGEWEVVIGMEVHAQVASEAKLFSGAATTFGAEPNAQVSLVDAAMPGMLPVINRKCVEQAVRTGLGLKAKINERSVFDRKNYFYPDLPTGYQISQYKSPVVGEGVVTLDLEDGATRAVGIERLHLEQDAGKSLHDQDPARTFVDLNRAGVALMEIVSKPDLRSAGEAAAYFTKLRSILRYLGTCDGDMEKGSLRADVNVSVRRPGEPLGTRTETKNLNSIRFVRQAIDYEASRQIEVLEEGGEIVQETRLYDPERGETRPMRSKEEAHDYRYFPDPDLLPLVIAPEWIEEIRATLPELPDEKKARFVRDYKMLPDVAANLVSNKEMADEFEKTERESIRLREEALEDSSERKVIIKTYHTGSTETKDDESGEERPSNLPDYNVEVVLIADATASNLGIEPGSYLSVNTLNNTAKANTNVFVNQVFSFTSRDDPSLPESTFKYIAELNELELSGSISGRQKKDVFELMWKEKRSPLVIVDEKGFKQISDTSEIEGIIDQLIADNEKQVEQFRGGNDKVLGWFVGQVMKATQGKANPQVVNELLRKKLGS